MYEGGRNVIDMNRRNYTRIQIVRKAQVIMPDNTSINCPVHDISLTGILLEGSTDFPLGIYCTVILNEELSTRSVTLNFAGQLVRKDIEHIAIQLLETDQKTFDLLKTIILYEIPDPVSFCKEITDNMQMELYQTPEAMRNSLINGIHMSH